MWRRYRCETHDAPYFAHRCMPSVCHHERTRGIPLPSTQEHEGFVDSPKSPEREGKVSRDSREVTHPGMQSICRPGTNPMVFQCDNSFVWISAFSRVRPALEQHTRPCRPRRRDERQSGCGRVTM